ncbi:MAG: alpha/beta hydrolase [Balneolales bacterium]
MLSRPGRNAKIPILLQHGWGFDSRMWNDWVVSYPEYNFLLPDRGYSGNAKKIDLQKTEIAVTHSLGLHLLPEKLFPQLKLLVIISGFQEYHPNTPIERTFSQRIVRHMLKNIKNDTNAVLDKFYVNSFLPALPNLESYDNPDTELLHKDLEMLNSHKVEIEALRLPDQVVLLHGMQDGIVAYNKAYQLQYSLQGSKVQTYEKAGHMVPVTHREWCMNCIKPFIT